MATGDIRSLMMFAAVGIVTALALSPLIAWRIWVNWRIRRRQISADNEYWVEATPKSIRFFKFEILLEIENVDAVVDQAVAFAAAIRG